MPDQNAAREPSLAQRAAHELRTYLGVTVYLWACFAALLFYKSTILHSEGVAYTAYGIAIVKALILGKFMLLGHAARLGERSPAGRIVTAILWQSLVFALMLILLTLVEEAAVGMFHGHTLQDTVNNFADGSLLEAVAIAVLMFMIMIPYFGSREIAQVHGDGTLVGLLLAHRPASARR